MNELQIFNYNGNEVRTIQKDGEPWWVLKDVCSILDIENHKDLPKRLEEDEVGRFDLPHPQSKEKTLEMLCINESGLYNVILRSDKPEAKPFRKWVTSEVLPSIRKTGAYSLPKTTAGQIQLLAQGHMELEQKIDSVNDDLQDFKRTMPLLAIDCHHIVDAKNRKVVFLLGGKDGNAYKNKSLRGKVYRDLEGQLRREFDVRSYKEIHRNQVGKALEIINKYELPLFLAELVAVENAQMPIL